MNHDREQLAAFDQPVTPALDASGVSVKPERTGGFVWWMQNLGLLSLLQTACLTIGLLSLQGVAHSSSAETSLGATSTGWLWTAIQIVLLQGALGYLIFARLYRCCRFQQQQSDADLNHHRVALSRTQDAVIIGLTQLAESRDGDTDGHLDRVGQFSACLAVAASRHADFACDITDDFIRLIQISSALHDIGKVGIEDSILQKPGRLTDDERLRMQTHTHISSQCLNRIEACLGDSNFLQMAHQIALFHHEWWDGNGYPTGLAGHQIPLAARIVAIADVYDALSARRVYKSAYPHEQCVAMIAAASGTQFDPRLIDVFLAVEMEFRTISERAEKTVSDERAEPNARARHISLGHREKIAERDQLDSLLASIEDASATVSCSP